MMVLHQMDQTDQTRRTPFANDTGNQMYSRMGCTITDIILLEFGNLVVRGPPKVWWVTGKQIKK